VDKSKSVLVVTIFIFMMVKSFASSIYEKNCLSCHSKMPVKIDKFFYRYLLKYSSEMRVKEALVDYLKNPKKEKSVLQEELLARFGVKKPTTLNDKELKEAVDEYWEIYKVFDKLKGTPKNP